MDKIKIEINASSFSLEISEILSDIIQKIERKSPIKPLNLFATSVLYPKNPSGIDQLKKRDDFKHNGNQWISKQGFIPLSLQYKFWQGGSPIRLDLKAKGDMVLMTDLSIRDSRLEVVISSDINIRIKDTIIVNGRSISINDILYLKEIKITDNSILYFFNKKNSLDTFVTIDAIYNPVFANEKLKEKFFTIEVESSNSLKEKVVNKFVESLANEKCGGPAGSGDYTLWARIGTTGDCHISGGGCGQGGRPGYTAISCHETLDEANYAWATTPRCQNKKYESPFDLAKKMLNN